MEFPWWVTAGLAMVMFWPATLAGVLVLGTAGYFVRGWWRALLWVPAGVALLVLLVGGGLFGWSKLQEWRGDQQARAERERLHVVLDKAALSDGLLLPAGSKVQWTSEARTDFSNADLSAPVPLDGWMLKGHVERLGDGALTTSYEVTLAQPRVMGEWPCGADEAFLGPAGQWMGCVLERPTLWHGLALPAGTYAGTGESIGGALTGMRFVMPDAQGTSLLGVQVPRMGVIRATAAGLPVDVDASWHKKLDPGPELVVRGVTLGRSLKFVDADGNAESGKPIAAVSGQLQKPLVCKAETLAEGDVTVPLNGDAVKLATYDEQHGSGTREVRGCLR